MAWFVRAILWSAAFSICVGAAAQTSHDYIITARRSGVIEFIDPATLKTLSSITIDVAPSSTGLNGVFANPDGRTIYVEGPIGKNSAGMNNCCWLYSIDLATLRTKVAAGIWGTLSRRRFISVRPGLIQPISVGAVSATGEYAGERWLPSPDGHWWFGLRNGPALDLYDVTRGAISRSFAAKGFDDPELSDGTWLGNRFYVYARHDGSGRLWTLSAESTELGESVALPEPEQIPGCASDTLTDMIAAGDRLVIYEVFGSKIDRRSHCGDVPGGATVVDPAAGQFAMPIAADLHFWTLTPNLAGSELYGITSEVPGTQAPARLVRIDARTGKVLQSRSLESDYWWLTTASLVFIPSGDVPLALSAGEAPSLRATN